MAVWRDMNWDFKAMVRALMYSTVIYFQESEPEKDYISDPLKKIHNYGLPLYQVCSRDTSFIPSQSLSSSFGPVKNEMQSFVNCSPASVFALAVQKPQQLSDRAALADGWLHDSESLLIRQPREVRHLARIKLVSYLLESLIRLSHVQAGNYSILINTVRFAKIQSLKHRLLGWKLEA